MLVTSVKIVPAPYNITNVLPGLIKDFPTLNQDYIDFPFWENTGLLDGLEEGEKFTLAILLARVGRYCIDAFEGINNETHLSDRESDVLIHIVARLYRRNRLNDFDFVIYSFNDIRSNMQNLFADLHGYPDHNANAEITALICQLIEEVLGFKHIDHYDWH